MVVTGVFGLYFHVRSTQGVEAQLRERMLSTVSIAALSIDASQIERIRTEQDMNLPVYRDTVNQLMLMRALSPQVRFAYIMRRTDNPDMVAFVADADALSDASVLDVNGNGIVDEDEAPAKTGEEYDISDLPALYAAFTAASVDEEVTQDQWGRLISAYAPIKNNDGETVAVLGMDIKADEYFRVTQETFSLIAVLVIALIGALFGTYVLLVIRSRGIQALRQLESERSALIDLATHQLGMPLATFRWWQEILKDGDKKNMPKPKEIAVQMQQGIDRLDMIIKGLREAANLQTDIERYKGDSASVSSVARSVVKDVEQVTKSKRQKIDVSIPLSTPAVRIDRKLFYGMLRELLENASAYSPDRSRITLSVHRVRRGVEIAVADHGCGVPASELPRIFEKFRRGSNATKFKPVGNGLGLYIVKSIVEKAGGRIRIDSVLGKGTTLKVLLPFA